MTDDEGRELGGSDELYLLRIATFILRYRWSLIGFPAAGFLLAVGWTAVTAETRVTAAAKMRGPAVLDSLVTAPSIIGQTAAATGSPSLEREDVEVSRSDEVLTVRLTGPSDSAAVRRLSALVATARDAYEKMRAPRIVAPDSVPAADSLRERVAEAERAVAAQFRTYPELEVLGAPHRPQAIMGDTVRTGREAAGLFELSRLLSRLDAARSAWSGILERAAEQRTLSRDYASRQARALEDSIEAWAGRVGPGSLSAAERWEYQALLWRLTQWRKVASTAGDAAERPDLELLAEPEVSGVRRAGALENGVFGLLLGGLLGFVSALFREAVRRGRERDSLEYREFRDVMRDVRGASGPEGSGGAGEADRR